MLRHFFAIVRRNFVVTCWVLLLLTAVALYSRQNHTSYARHGNFSVLTEQEMDRAFPIRVAGDKNRYSQQEELPGPQPSAPIAKKYTLERKAGLSFFGRGHDTSFTADVPEFMEDSPFLRRLSQRLKSEYQNSAIEFTSFDWSLVYDGLRNPEYYLLKWNHSTSLDFMHLSRHSASVMEINWEYTGGMHGNSYFVGRNFVEENGSIRELMLEELFEPTSDWTKRLIAFCLSDLHAQGASHISGTCVEEADSCNFSLEDLTSFTLSSEGLRFYFSPYHVGCYAEGMYNVRVPYSVIEECIPDRSPLRMFMEHDDH